MIPHDFKLDEEGERLRSHIALMHAVYIELGNAIGKRVVEFEQMRQEQWFKAQEEKIK